jgi:outer membrane receptor protein involved in Fe transport
MGNPLRLRRIPLRFNYSHTPSYSTNRLDTFGGAVPLPDSAMFVSPYDATSSTWAFAGRTIGSLAAGSAAYDQSSQFNVVDSFSWLRGEHQMKFGVDFRRMYPRADRSAYGQTLAATLTTASWVNGTLSQYATSAFSPKDFTYYNVGAYAQDAWHATPRLTLTYGSIQRPEVRPVCRLHSRTGPVESRRPSLPDGTPPYEAQWNGFAPRVGFISAVRRRTMGRVHAPAPVRSSIREAPPVPRAFVHVRAFATGVPDSGSAYGWPTIPTSPPWASRRRVRICGCRHLSAWPSHRHSD